MRGILVFSPILSLFCLVSAIYMASYYEKSHQSEEQNAGTTIQAGRKEEDPSMDSQNMAEGHILAEKQDHDITNQIHQETQNVIPADDNTDIYITPRMTYTLEIYDARSRQLTNETQPIPNDMYGLNRVELEQYLIQLAEQENREDDELERHYQVTVFSRRAFTVRKTITEKKPEYAVFLIAEEGWLRAYTGDRTAVYEELSIALEDFPLEQQAMLTQGIYMKTLADYYDFLETYSS